MQNRVGRKRIFLPSLKLFLIFSISGLDAKVSGQQFDLCPYIYLDVTFREDRGEAVKTYSPEIDTLLLDSVATFMKAHYNRFSYLLYNKLGDMSQVAEEYPDTLKMDSLMCSIIQKNTLFQVYVSNLLPLQYRTYTMAPDTFTVDDLMFVASHFFYCLEIEESDSTILSHVCVNLKDQEFIPFQRDVTLLEAFAFEGIFHALLREDHSRFHANFQRYINESRDRYKDTAGDLNELLIKVRHECFALMETDEDLKESLLQYYRQNRNNLHFLLTGQGI